ncbi:ABC transporter permease subunit [Aeromicrobium sp. 636]|uniref:ABC transporter permease subunit n=1 Tax=Aeromicrobium senzhongii TaxID=2663859 RepID=A0A8I0ESS4_9ACTN|nr:MULTISPECIES: ABC transporter permease subunit [Aeromicrobium]MBC9224742.1 ABC transporter permease subunit [Aeromicrobium senzhongii]MCQ3996855.1 ABC transporter permease subunit [Aeromicrobium sp. 636]MTB86788.1 ABC transporter permease subunit [Aeromicrobium senzhongii]QNL93369.1 ABC transporter permease subunit [Aeromicrobium senzhongii]
MSTTTTNPTIDLSRPGVPFGREVKVEVRKMIDTRGGIWLFGLTGVFILLAMALTLLVIGLNDDVTITAGGFAEIMALPVSLLLPVFAILIVSSEWSQRTHLTTFTLQPNRGRVILAKFVAVSVLALATIVIAVAFGALGNVIYGIITPHDVVWNVPIGDLAWTVASQLLFFWMAFALAMLLLNTPAAIAVFYIVALILPVMVYPILMALFGWAQDLLPWINIDYALMMLRDGTTFLGDPIDVGPVDYLRLVVTLVLWIVIPGTLGFLRVRSTEVK